MKIQSILLEKVDSHSSTVKATSAILIEDKYVLATSNLLHNFLQENIKLTQNLEAGKLHLYTRKQVQFRAFWKNEGQDIFTSKRAKLFALLKCKNINEFCQNDFKDWSTTERRENTTNIKDFISVFVVLVMENRDANEQDLKSTMHSWLINTSTVKISKCDRLVCMSSPFGSREFLNSVCEGIVSTTLKQSTLFLSDCSTTPGCEGGLVYFKDRLDLPIGIIISSFNWWRKDWVGFTLVADIRPILYQLVNTDQQIVPNAIQMNTLSQLVETSENCLVQINCGVNWGTGILLSANKGIFLTNAHVVCEDLNIRLLWKNRVKTAQLVYRSPDDSAFDLAIVKMDASCWPFTSSLNLQNIFCKVADTVYCAGYPLLSTCSKPDGISITHGVISSSQPYMIKTTCGVYPGFSGGAVFGRNGNLLGIIVCNTKLSDADVNMTYPNYNMAIPFKAVSDILLKYLEFEDTNLLKNLGRPNSEADRVWWKLEGKL